MTWADSYDEREEYLWTVHNLIPSTAGIWGQPMLNMKYVTCEDPTREECSCVEYDQKFKDEAGFSGINYARGGVWSEIMRLADQDMMSDCEVSIHM